MSKPRYLTEVAEHFRVSRMTIHRWIKLVPLPGYDPSNYNGYATVKTDEKTLKEWYENVQGKLGRRVAYIRNWYNDYKKTGKM